MGDSQRFQLIQSYPVGGAPAEQVLLDMWKGTTWERDRASNTWREIPVQAISGSPASSARERELAHLVERGVKLVRAVQTSYNWTQQEIDQFEADCHAAGVNVP